MSAPLFILFLKSFKSVKHILWITIILLITTNSSLFSACALDQSQLVYNAGTSARNLSQYTVWQSFKPGMTGTLCRIDMGFFNAMTGTGTLKIYSGTGTGGTLKQTLSVTVSGTGNFFQTFNVAVAVTSGQTYTFQFTPTQGGGLPDPYGVQCVIPSAYPNGEYDITDPSGTYSMGGDLVFKTYVNSALPVELLDFSGEQVGNHIQLNWTTATEINNDYFNIERSNDAINFHTIGKVNGVGNSNTIFNYSFIDENPSNGINYYCLKQIDFNGNYEYFEAIAVTMGSEIPIRVYPNPSHDYIKIEVPSNEKVNITIKDMIGNSVRVTDNININEPIDIQDLHDGIYFIEIKSDLHVKSIKFIKQ